MVKMVISNVKKKIIKKKTEKDIENEILEYLNLVGIFSWKHENGAVYDPTRKQFRLSHSKFKFKGISDIIGIVPTGRLIALEVKRPDTIKKVTADQLLFGEKIRNSGGIFGVVCCLKDAQDILIENGILKN